VVPKLFTDFRLVSLCVVIVYWSFTSALSRPTYQLAREHLIGLWCVYSFLVTDKNKHLVAVMPCVGPCQLTIQIQIQIQESRAVARKPRDATAVLFGFRRQHSLQFQKSSFESQPGFRVPNIPARWGVAGSSNSMIALLQIYVRLSEWKNSENRSLFDARTWWLTFWATLYNIRVLYVFENVSN